MTSLQLLPVEILAHTLVHCQKTTAVAQTCRYLRAFVSTNTFVAAWIIMWHGRRNALSQRAMWGQVISPNLILSLLYQGSDVHADSDWALRAAAANGWYPLTRTLIEEYGSDVHALDGYALRWSSYSGHTDVVEYLLQRGALVGVYNCLRGPADQGNLEIIRKLVAAGALDPDGGAVQSAARHGHLEILQYLTKHIVRTRRSEDHLAEALRQAASNAHDEIVKYLVVECNAGFGTGLINAHTSATLHGHKSTVLLLTNLADEVNDRYLGDM